MIIKTLAKCCLKLLEVSATALLVAPVMGDLQGKFHVDIMILIVGYTNTVHIVGK